MSIQAGNAIHLNGVPLFGMEIERVASEPDGGWEIETTGAIYRVRRGSVVGQVSSPQARCLAPVKTWIDLIRKIDPVTNTVNPSLVGRLEFQTIIEPFGLESADREVCVLKNKLVELRFHSDSLFFVNDLKLATLAYRYTSLLAGPGLRRGHEQRHSRLWTDGHGGALHALASGREDIAGAPDTATDPDTTDFAMTPGERVAHMVFPARSFDFDGSYGASARPCIFTTCNLGQLTAVADDADSPASSLRQQPPSYVAGLVAQQLGDPRIVWLLRYPELVDHEPLWHEPLWHEPLWHEPLWHAHLGPAHLWRRHLPPVLYPTLPLVGPEHVPGAEAVEQHHETGAPYLGKAELAQVRQCVQRLHARGLKVLIGLGEWPIYLPESHTHLALEWLTNLLREYGFDGFYLDHGTYGDQSDGAWLPAYEFFRRLRKEVLAELGKELHLFHRNSSDAWSNQEHGQLRGIMMDTYINATLTGEVAPGPASAIPTMNIGDWTEKLTTAPC